VILVASRIFAQRYLSGERIFASPATEIKTDERSHRALVLGRDAAIRKPGEVGWQAHGLC